MRTKNELAALVWRELARSLPATGRQTSGGESPAPMAEWESVNQGILSEMDVLNAYAAATGIPVVEDDALKNIDVFPEATRDFLVHHECVPIAWDGVGATIAISNPYSTGGIANEWRTFFGRNASFALARRSMINHTLTRLYAEGFDAATGGDVNSNAALNEEALKDLAQEAPIVRLVNDMFNRAVEMRASDIHVEPSENQLDIRYRIDGVLHTVLNPPLSHYPAIASRLKLTAGMNIAERRLPQDGRIETTINGHRIDMRVSTVPSMHGESIVLRLLEKETKMFELDSLGMDAAMLEKFKKLVAMPYGMLLVVGPTGSGKSTTLYGVMRMLNSRETKIITIEDPVEYQLNGLTQIQVRPQIGLTFANGLRSIVRQDPDIILVGEIRDRETAEIAVHAALTGHLVFSTLHTNDAAGAVSRLLEMGIEGFLISSALLGVLSQRLVRTVCPECNGKNLLAQEKPGDQQARCRACGGTGFRGRMGIFELLVIDDELRNAVNNRKDSTELARIARRSGMKNLYEDGIDKVESGRTTMGEVARVCQLDSTS